MGEKRCWEGDVGRVTVRRAQAVHHASTRCKTGRKLRDGRVGLCYRAARQWRRRRRRRRRRLQALVSRD
ncbi:hypothetical protein E2C01_096279 [Portunus trituberculatus]|uniref:Uncharacterized protein n=1 Tax=Portunus trituberculatus TaxID=210409 RepID=A0A5B7K1B7_PORTR|nr:hypothetical protein [Portunus trituberculatus]